MCLVLDGIFVNRRRVHVPVGCTVRKIISLSFLLLAAAGAAHAQRGTDREYTREPRCGSYSSNIVRPSSGSSLQSMLSMPAIAWKSPEIMDDELMMLSSIRCFFA